MQAPTSDAAMEFSNTDMVLSADTQGTEIADPPKHSIKLLHDPDNADDMLSSNRPAGDSLLHHSDHMSSDRPARDSALPHSADREVLGRPVFPCDQGFMGAPQPPRLQDYSEQMKTDPMDGPGLGLGPTEGPGLSLGAVYSLPRGFGEEFGGMDPMETLIDLAPARKNTPRKMLTISEKMDVVKVSEAGKFSQRKLAAMFDISKTQVVEILRNKEAIRTALEENLLSGDCKKLRTKKNQQLFPKDSVIHVPRSKITATGGEAKPALEENGGGPYIADDQPTSETLQTEPPLSAQYIAGLLEADDLSSDNADIPPPNTTPYSAANLNQRKLLSYATNNQRKPIKNEDKLRLILTCKGKAQAEIAAEFNIMEKTVFEILRDRDEIEEEYISLRRGIRDELLASLNTGAHKPAAAGSIIDGVRNNVLSYTPDTKAFHKPHDTQRDNNQKHVNSFRQQDESSMCEDSKHLIVPYDIAPERSSPASDFSAEEAGDNIMLLQNHAGEDGATGGEEQDQKLQDYLNASWVSSEDAAAIAKSMKRKRTALSVEEKMLILQHKGSGSLRKTADTFGIGKTTVLDIFRRGEEITAAFYDDSLNPQRKKMRTWKVTDRNYAMVDNAVYHWYRSMVSKGILLSGPKVQKQAVALAHRLGMLEFKASNGWLNGFCKRHRVQFGKRKKPVPDPDIPSPTEQDTAEGNDESPPGADTNNQNTENSLKCENGTPDTPNNQSAQDMQLTPSTSANHNQQDINFQSTLPEPVVFPNQYTEWTYPSQCLGTGTVNYTPPSFTTAQSEQQIKQEILE